MVQLEKTIQLFVYSILLRGIGARRPSRPILAFGYHQPFTSLSSSSSSLYSTHSSKKMPRGVKKQDLPSKTCVVCQRPFTWRKKWEKVWDEVTTCSKSCNRKRRAVNQQTNRNNKNDDTVEPSLMIDDDMMATTNVEDPLSLLLVPADDEIVSSGSEKEAAGSASDDEESKAAQESDDPRRAARKAAKKERKAERRAKLADPTRGQKPCDICGKRVDLLVRCTIDASGEWKMVCGASCWKTVSGGVVDGDANHPHYRYGGLWKNRVKTR